MEDTRRMLRLLCQIVSSSGMSWVGGGGGCYYPIDVDDEGSMFEHFISLQFCKLVIRHLLTGTEGENNSNNQQRTTNNRSSPLYIEPTSRGVLAQGDR